MQSAQNKSKTKIFIASLIVFATVVIIGGAVYAVVQISSQAADTQSTDAASNGKSDTVSQQSLNQSRNDLTESVKQAKEAHAQAEAAVNDSSKRVKVSE